MSTAKIVGIVAIAIAILVIVAGGPPPQTSPPEAPRVVAPAETPERKASLKDFCAAAEAQTIEQQAAADAKEVMRRMAENSPDPPNIQKQLQSEKVWADALADSTLLVESERLWCHPTAPSEPTQFPTFKGWGSGPKVKRAQQKWEQITSETVRSTCKREAELYAKHILRGYELGRLKPYNPDELKFPYEFYIYLADCLEDHGG